MTEYFQYEYFNMNIENKEYFQDIKFEVKRFRCKRQNISCRDADV